METGRSMEKVCGVSPLRALGLLVDELEQVCFNLSQFERESNLMIMQADAIVDIPAERVKFFGTTGRMLLPSPATLQAAIADIPAGQLLTTDRLRQRLAAQFKVEAVCPVTTRRSLKALAQTGDGPYWRVINADGGLNADYPGGVTAHADHLREEGIIIDVSGKKPKVSDYQTYLQR